MDGPKLRVIVEFSAYAGTGLSRLVVPVFSTQTVAQLAAEVSRRRGLSSDVVPQLSLALLDGSLLFPDDQVGDVIRPDEPVYARINELSPSAVSSVTAPTPSHPPLEPRGKPKGNELPESYHALPDPAVKDKHVKVALITLELARNSGKEEPAKVLAFEGRAVSVKFSMDTIRREAARALGWLSEFRELALALLLISSLLRDVSNNFTAPEKSTVPFAESPVVTIRMLPSGTAFSVLRHLHWSARYVLNCSGFPARDACRRSMRMVREEEPKALNTALWVQNAGCKHIFHAHCYFSRTSSVQGCPAGCPTSLVSAEAIPFDTRSPHLVVVHSGSVVGKVQLPDGFIVADEAMINLSDQEIIDILSSKYHHLGPGLMVRMYDRKNTGLVSFRHSTVVSICCTSRHVEFDGIRRFSLNGPPPSPPELTHVVDLHHVSSPIFNESPFLTIEDLGLDSGVQDGEEIALYVIRKHRVELVEVKRVGKAAVYTTRADWHPAIRQTDRGMAAFLSALLVFTHYLSVSGKSTDEKNMQTRMLNHLLALTRFPPAVRSLYVLTMNGSLHPEEMRALSEAMYHLALDVVHPHVTKGDTTRVFEGTRILFSMLVERPKGPFTLPGQDFRASAVQPFKHVPLACELSGESLRDPVLYGGVVVEQRLSDRKGALSSIPPEGPRQFSAAIDSKCRAANSRAPQSEAGCYSCTDAYEVGYNAVYISRGGPCAAPGEDMLILRPCHGGEAAVDVNVVALKLQPLIDARKKTDEWDIDAFGSSRTDRVDTREIEEAVDFNQTDSNVDEENSDQRAEQNLMNCFFRRRDGLSSAIESAKSFVTGLDCLLSISRYIYRGEPTQGSWREINRNVARRVERADKAIDELRILYARTHWQGTQSEASVVNTSLSDLEDFVAVATDRSLKAQLVDHLLQHAARVKEGSNTVASNGVPVRFIDPLSGDIFVDPVRATDGFVYERRCIESWRNVYGTSPLDPTIDIDADSPLISVGSLLQPILAFLRGRPRAFFRARQRPFLIQIGTGGGRARLFVTLPGTVSVLSILFDEWSFSERRPSTSRLWHGLRDYGDGSFRGRALEPITSLHDLSAYVESIGSDDRVSVNTLDLDLRAWHYIATGAERTRIDSRSMSRLDVVKQAFEAFINKSEAFDHPIAVGLVTFGRRVTEVQEVTLPKEQFRDTLKSVKADGDTPLFDGLAVAHSMLTRFKHQHPSTALRIICLTDGFDIGSNVSANAVAARLQQTGIIVDSIVVQTGRLTNVLHPISVVTGGYSFKVDTLENALNIVELETVLRAKDRVERPPKPIVRHQWHLSKYNDLWTYPMDVVTAEKCPDRKLHERLCEPLQSAHKAAARSAPPSSTDRQRRLMQEVRDIVNSPHPAIDVYVGDDLAFWKIVIEAPEGSPYEGGTFLAYIDFGGDYPQAAPEVRFITPILHPNINRHGKVCHAALDRNWLVDMTINVVLQILYGILLTPDTDNPLELHATMEYNDDGGNHALKVHDMVKKFAAKNREAWRKELEEIDSTNKD